MLMSRKEGLKKYLNLILFTLKECLLPLQVLHNKFRKDWPKSSLEENVNGRLTAMDANP